MTSSRKSSAEPKVLRQTFLKFKTLPRQVIDDSESSHAKVSKPPPFIPPEIWTPILKGLSTIALKSVRLVCKAWSDAAKQALFETVYLDSFDSSWLRLVQLSKSPCAYMVDTIVWSPLYLPADCIHADAWRARYVNILKGLSHTECSELHRIYRHLLRQGTGEIRNPKWLWKSSLDLGAFVSCREVIVSDMIEMETSCTDSNLRRRVQNDKDLLNRAAIWGISPTFDVFGHTDPNQDASLLSRHNVFHLLHNLPHVSRFSSSLLVENQLTILREPTRRIPGLEHVKLQFRFYHFAEIDVEYDPPARIGLCLYNSMQFLSRFPYLNSITIESTYTDPGAKFNRPYRRKYLRWLNDENSEDENTNEADEDDEDDEDDKVSLDRWTLNSAGSRLSQFCFKFRELPTGLTRKHVDALEAILVLGIKEMPDLTELTLHNISIDVQSLLGWLANQPQTAEEGIVLRFCGSNILYGFDPRAFLQILEALKVRIVFDSDETLYYVADFTGHATSFCDLNVKVQGHHSRKVDFEVHFCSSDSEGFDLETLVHESQDGPIHIADIAIHDAAMQEESFQNLTTFIDRPHDITKIMEDMSIDMLNDSKFYYCCFVSSSEQRDPQPETLIFQWLNHPAFCLHEREKRRDGLGSQLFVLLEARAAQMYYDDESFYEQISVDPDHILEADDHTHAENFQEQAHLELYEHELLRLDVAGE